jgi:hypothetical protein
MKKFNQKAVTWFLQRFAIKKIMARFMVAFLLVAGMTAFKAPTAHAQVNISFQVFYDDLSPYGSWVNNSDYGYVWVPRVSRGFYPYGTNGHWVYTEDGWTWFSNYNWGWAPFHYGRWFYDPYYGWVWVPDNQWGPGWVTWRRSEGYYGWAPIAPGISTDVAYSNNYNLPYDRWRFVRDRDFGRSNISNYYVSPTNYTTIINRSTVINNIQVDRSHNSRFNAGPVKSEVEQRAGRKFTPMAIRESSRPEQRVSGNQLQIFRPQVQQNAPSGQRPQPRKVNNWKANQQTQQPQEKPKMQPSRPTSVQQNPLQPRPAPVRPRNDQPVKQLQEQKRNEQPVRQQQQPQPVPQRRNEQPMRQQQQPQPVPQRRNEQPVRQQQQQPQPQQQKRNEQPVRQQQQPQPIPQRRNEQPVRQQQQEQPQPQQQKRNEQPVRQQQQQQPQQQQQQQKQNQQPRNENPHKKDNR